jgi:hypothetical protein
VHMVKKLRGVGLRANCDRYLGQVVLDALAKLFQGESMRAAIPANVEPKKVNSRKSASQPIDLLEEWRKLKAQRQMR